MTFKHKLSRRLAIVRTCLGAAAFVVACAEAPTAVDEAPIRASDLDPALALTPSTLSGSQVRTDRYVQVFSAASRRSAVLGRQKNNVRGTLVAGPSAITSSDPYPLWQVDFDSGVDGWVYGAYLSLVAAPPGPAAVASVTVSPDPISVPDDSARGLTVVLRDSLGNALSGRSVTWASLNTAIASVSSGGVVTGVSAGTVLVSATCEGISGTASVTVTAPVAPPPPPPPSGERGLIWSSDFSSAAGTATLAIGDGDRWTMIGGQGLEVVSAAGLAFPTGNVLRVNAVQASSGFALVRTTALGSVAVGEWRFYRHYARYTFPDNLEDNQTHPIQDGGAGSQINWAWSIRHNNGGPGFYTAGLKLHTNNAFDLAEWTPPPLRKGVTYRFEHAIERVSATQFRMHARIYDVNGALLYDDDDFRSNYNTTSLASAPLLNFNDPANLNGLNGGNNGIGGSPTWPFTYAYQGAFAVCRTSWCGAYQAGEGR